VFFLCVAFASKNLAKVDTQKYKYFSERDLRLIAKNWNDYEWAARKAGIPSLILPAIHYRECQLFPGWYSSKLERPIKNIGGPFMLDFGPLNNGTEFKRRIGEYEKKVFKIYFGEGKAPKVSEDFRFAALCAAHHLKEKLRSDVWTTESLIDAVWGYNGRAKWSTLDESAYVFSDPMNGKQLTLIYKTSRGNKIYLPDKRPGVMIIYKEIYELCHGDNFNCLKALAPNRQ